MRSKWSKWDRSYWVIGYQNVMIKMIELRCFASVISDFVFQPVGADITSIHIRTVEWKRERDRKSSNQKATSVTLVKGFLDTLFVTTPSTRKRRRCCTCSNRKKRCIVVVAAVAVEVLQFQQLCLSMRFPLLLQEKVLFHLLLTIKWSWIPWRRHPLQVCDGTTTTQKIFLFPQPCPHNP